MMPNLMVGVVEGSAWFQRWYFEAEVDHLEQVLLSPTRCSGGIRDR